MHSSSQVQTKVERSKRCQMHSCSNIFLGIGQLALMAKALKSQSSMVTESIPLSVFGRLFLTVFFT